MKINNRVKELIKYWGKGFVIITGVMLIMTFINVSVNEEIITQFWQGFIVATSGFIYSQQYQQQKKNERISRIIEEIECLVDEHDNVKEESKIINERIDSNKKEQEKINKVEKDTK